MPVRRFEKPPCDILPAVEAYAKPGEELLDAVQRMLINQVLHEYGGVQAYAADRLRSSEVKISRRMFKFGMRDNERPARQRCP